VSRRALRILKKLRLAYWTGANRGPWTLSEIRRLVADNRPGFLAVILELAWADYLDEVPAECPQANSEWVLTELGRGETPCQTT
jgi:hypothetical protein